mgnify:CR=1 FL=1
MTEIKTLSKGLKALQIISESEVGIGTTELSKHLDTDKSSASRILKTLEKLDFIRRKRESRRYVIGSKLFSLTNSTKIVHDLEMYSKQSLMDLVNQTGEANVRIDRAIKVVGIDHFNLTLILHELDRVELITMSGTQGGDLHSVLLDVYSGAVQDVATNLNLNNFGINLDFSRKSYEEDNLKPQDNLTLMAGHRHWHSWS